MQEKYSPEPSHFSPERQVPPSEQLIEPEFTLTSQPGNVKSVTEVGVGYPERFPVKLGTSWKELNLAEYHPSSYTAEIVLKKDWTQNPEDPTLWADPVDPHQSRNAPNFESYEGTIELDDRGRPLNPLGPTGIEGRGLLGLWGRNRAVDPVVTRVNSQGQMEMIAIVRTDGNQLALPGGMLDRGEEVTVALSRELKEETDADLDFNDSQLVYRGYVDAVRNTDNAWIETDARHVHLADNQAIELQAGDDASEARWVPLTSETLAGLYDSHAFVVKRALLLWQQASGLVIDKQGFIGSPVDTA